MGHLKCSFNEKHAVLYKTELYEGFISPCFIKIPKLASSSWLVMQSFSPLFYFILQLFSNTLDFAIFSWLWWYANPNLPGVKGGLTEKSKKWKKWASFFWLEMTSDMLYSMHEIAKVKKKKRIIYNPREGETLLKISNMETERWAPWRSLHPRAVFTFT